mgnify:FL=1
MWLYPIRQMFPRTLDRYLNCSRKTLTLIYLYIPLLQGEYFEIIWKFQCQERLLAFREWWVVGGGLRGVTTLPFTQGWQWCYSILLNRLVYIELNNKALNIPFYWNSKLSAHQKIMIVENLLELSLIFYNF